ncbi:unnamed protein product [Closterium sp. NIES-64]|nr:unnamed protein product [Closterium sp. NIES-64]
MAGLPASEPQGEPLGAASSTDSTRGAAGQPAPGVASSTSATPATSAAGATSAPEKAAQEKAAVSVPSLHDISDHSSEEGDNDREEKDGKTTGAAAEGEKDEQGVKERANGEARPEMLNGNGTNGIAAAKADSGSAADVAAKEEHESDGDGNNAAAKPGLLAAWRRKAERLFPALLRVGKGGDGDDEGSSTALVPAAAAGVPAVPQVVVEDPPLVPRGSYWAVFQAFFLLGWTAFGGPSAHIAMYHKQFVELRGWMSEDVFAELLALTQAVPGPSSTQMSFSIGILQKGITGGLLSGALFQFPGALIMAIAGFGVAKFLIDPAPWLSALSAGLAAVAVALVAEAAVILGKKMCRNKVTRVLCVASAVITFYYATQWIFPTVILLGGVVTYFTERNKPIPPQRSDIQRLGVSPLVGGMLLFAWIAILVGSIVYKNATSYESAKWIHWFEGFYLTGSVTYGGGQVVLPLLENVVIDYETVCPPNGGKCYEVEANTSWVTSQQFLAGLALAQALPGPLFNFSAYIGAIVGGMGGVIACWFGLFSPGILIIYGVLPFWGKFRQWKL